ncbi:MAG: hypothetical protein D6795_01150 [Deltaproteobacteria bacterium]|nr:MAG: hypothetical protein D6795_01150 [Deltaproteobacteria bacterium]
MTNASAGEPPIPLGAFDLDSMIGQGGMAKVWRGRHRTTGRLVAVKVLSERYADDSKHRAALRREIEAVSRLHHPRIVHLFDHGEVPSGTARESQGRLVAGTPYIVMEFVRGGTLQRVIDPPLPWPPLRTFLLELLDALAHAHARGIIHRDLKPVNILLFGEDLSEGWKLTDFGLAHATENDERLDQGITTEHAAGTPCYMAPEQWEGQVRDYGPWTDLYALGCIAYELISGRPPFLGGMRELMRSHLFRIPLPPSPRVPLPGILQEWVMRLLEKEPGNRFPCAADAAWALAQIPATREEGRGAPLARGDPESVDGMGETLALGGMLTTTLPPEATLSDSPQAAPVPSLSSPLATADAPPSIPEGWEEEPHPLPPALPGVGPNLLRLRTLPLVGRRRERDLLWKALREVVQDRQPRAVLLAGPAGSGKSRLAQWLAERAHETGAAVIFKAFHPPTPGPSDALARMVARHFGCIGLPRPKVLARIERSLHATGEKRPEEAQALTELIVPEETTGEGIFGSRVQRYLLVARVLERAAQARPALVWLDDVQWGSDTLEFVDFLLRYPEVPEFPCLLLLTLQEEALTDHPFEAAQVAKLRRHDRCATLALPPLPPADHLRLIEQMVEGDLALRIAERTAGNPMFAVELVIALVQRGRLETTAEGFALKAGATLELPDDLYQVWRTRIDRFLDGEPPQLCTALELAATLGLEVEREVWERVTRSAGIPIPLDLEDRLVSKGLAEPMETGWAFVHAMLRETLERQAREGGRWPAHNRLCAKTFASLDPLRVPDRDERLGRHLLEAGERSAALDPLWRGSLRRLHRSDYRSALSLLLLREKALEELGIPRSDPRWIEGWCLRTRIHELQGEFDEVRRWARRIQKAARPGEDDHFLAEALRALGNAERQAGNLRQALCFLEAAGEIFERSGDRISLAKILASSGDVARQRGDFKGAEQFFRRSLALHRKARNTLGVATVCSGLGNVARQTGRLEEAAAFFEEARSLFEQLDNPIGIANCLNGLAETARARGNFAAAEAGYRKAFEVYETVGSRNAIVMKINLALLLLARRCFSEAKTILRDTLDRSGKRPPQALQACLHLALLPCAAAEGAWEAWDEHYRTARALLEQTGLIDPDVAWSAELAGDLALSAGEGQRARQAYGIARRQWEKLGDPGKCEALDRKIWGGGGYGDTPA